MIGVAGAAVFTLRDRFLTANVANSLSLVDLHGWSLAPLPM